MTRVFSVIAVLGSAAMVVFGRPGAFWFFFVGMLATILEDIANDVLRKLYEARAREADERNEKMAKALADLNASVQGDLRDLKKTLLEKTQPEMFSSPFGG